MAKKRQSGSGPKKTEVPKTTFDVSREVHQLSRNNAKLVKKSKKVGCFHCLTISLAKDVKAYFKCYSIKDATNAVCPKCSTDSLIPDASGIELTEAFLKAMRSKWFNI